MEKLRHIHLGPDSEAHTVSFFGLGEATIVEPVTKEPEMVIRNVDPIPDPYSIPGIPDHLLFPLK